MTYMRILALSPIESYGGFNTSKHRINALRQLGFHVDVIDSSLNDSRKYLRTIRRLSNYLFRSGLPLPLVGGGKLGKALLKELAQREYDLIWLEKALDINSSVIKRIKYIYPSAKIIGFSPDDMSARHNQSQQFLDTLQSYDLFITTKSYNVNELINLGCANATFVPNGFDPEAFKPMQLSAGESMELGGDVGFIGSFEDARFEMLSSLAKNGLSVRVWGDSWPKYSNLSRNLRFEYRSLLGESFAKAVSSFKINLNFLRKLNRDLQTTRSVEIPACGGFMLAERTEEHLSLFKEGVEAEYFSSSEELIEKCLYYLANDTIRIRIANAGYQRCIRDGYTNADRLKTALLPLLCSFA